jgi:Protein of unknown function (DUF3604)
MLVLALVVLTACGDSSRIDPSRINPHSPSVPPDAGAVVCENRDALRQPYFGDLHVHTKYSVDAEIFGTHNGPAEAYAFGRGATLDLGPIDPAQPSQLIHLNRPLDFLAVTDHSEGYGFSHVCETPSDPGYSAPECVVYRGGLPLPTQIRFLTVAGAVLNPVPVGPAVCRTPGVDCPAGAATVWGDIRAAAKAANDPCHFTSFVGYEWSATPGNANLHRNVIFANDQVPDQAISYTDTGSSDVTQLWSKLQTACKDGVPGCDVLTIAHNSNVSMGLMFTDPKDATEAANRQIWEPLVEITQHKGASECRFDTRFGAGVGTSDEQCAFEQIPYLGLIPFQNIPDAAQPPPQAFSGRAFVRNVLRDGLAIEQQGLVDPANPTALAHINPFKFGLIGSTDTHDGTPGATDDYGWKGHGGNQEATPAQRVGSLSNITRNPGGLAVLWAEQNSRDSLFAAMRRRESYATSGTRPLLRFFGGWDYPANLCDSPDLVKTGYARGVPMGSDLPAKPAAATSPAFVAWARQDAGTAEHPGTPLQRIQIVKGWVDALGQTHEQIYDIAPAAPSTSRAVDPNTCKAEQRGAPELCTVWHDPDFDPARPAVYYARVLEDPGCRWHVEQCRALGVDPFAANCDTSSNNPNNHCCAAVFDPVTQERAWASPVWYRPAS